MRKRHASQYANFGSLQIEARITAATLILGTIVLNILWWAGIQFMETDNSREITQKVQPIEHRITQNGLARH